MRCSTIDSTIALGDEPCQGTATHLLLGSLREDEGSRKPFRDPVCEPCGRAYERRPALKARRVPLHVHNPIPEFKDGVEGHRLIDHPEHESQCYDCRRTGTVNDFKFSMLHGCPARPESVDHLKLTGDDRRLDANGRAEKSARLWWNEIVDLDLPVEDWRPVLNHPMTCATFTFKDREYRVKYDLGGHAIFAEKLRNRGRPEPELINAEYQQSYKQVAFYFHTLITDSGSMHFATYTPGREDVILYAPEGQISAVLRIAGLNFPESTHLAQITDAVCDAFGAVSDVIFQTRVYE